MNTKAGQFLCAASRPTWAAMAVVEAAVTEEAAVVEAAKEAAVANNR